MPGALGFSEAHETNRSRLIHGSRSSIGLRMQKGGPESARLWSQKFTPPRLPSGRASPDRFQPTASINLVPAPLGPLARIITQRNVSRLLRGASDGRKITEPDPFAGTIQA